MLDESEPLAEAIGQAGVRLILAVASCSARHRLWLERVALRVVSYLDMGTGCMPECCVEVCLLPDCFPRVAISVRLLAIMPLRENEAHTGAAESSANMLQERMLHQ